MLYCLSAKVPLGRKESKTEREHGCCYEMLYCLSAKISLGRKENKTQREHGCCSFPVRRRRAVWCRH